MSLFDHNQDHHDVVGSVATSAFSEITDSIRDPHSAIKVLAITVTTEIGAFVMFYFAKDKVIEYLSESEVDIWIYGGIAVFLIGFLTAFAAYRLIAIKWPHISARLMIWLVSTAAGLLNLGLFFALITFQMK